MAVIENANQTNKDYPVIYIDGTSDIHYEAPEEFEKSVLSTEFEKAFRITEEIVKGTENALNVSKSNKSDKGTKIRNEEQVYNIIFFTGERGSGKTSAMLSYMEFLKDYYRNTTSEDPKETIGDLEFHEGKYMFTGLEYIDASSLDKKEDILGSVLSKMLKKWKEEEGRGRGDSGIVKVDDYEYKKHKIRGQFSEIYQRVKDLRSDKDLMQIDSDMYLDTLERLSLTWNVKNSFQKLVNAYLDIMVYPRSQGTISSKNHFLVISIDDIDMNIKHGFMLLEQIRKYLMVPNVIVLLSANYEQLEKICINHYSKKFKAIKKYSGTGDYIHRLSREYLEKMVPISHQVRLKSGRSWRFYDKDKLIIRCSKAVWDKEGKKEEGIEEYGPETLTEIVRKVMKDYFYMGFAPNSKCINYLTPNTLRELCTLFIQINDLKRLTVEEGKNIIDVYEHNIKWFVDIEFPRLCKTYLSVSDYKIIDSLDILEISEQIEQIQKRGKDVRLSSLEVLAGAMKESGENQAFASISLIYFTMKLAESAFRLKNAKMEQERERALDGLLRYYFINTWGIWGNWEKKIIPRIFLSTDSVTGNEVINIARTYFLHDNNCLLLDFGDVCNKRELKAIKEFISKHRKLLENYQYLLLFYKLDIKDPNMCIWSKVDGTQIKLSESYSGIFSLSGFILNLFEGAKLVKSFSENLQELLFPHVEKKIYDKVKAECDSVSIWTEEFQQAIETPLLPLDNIEFLIYMGRRIQDRLYNKDGKGNRSEDIRDSIKKFFAIMQECLDEYDIIYKTRISYRFRNFPLVSKISSDDSAFIDLLIEKIECHTEPFFYDDNIEWSGEGENG